MQPQVPDEGSRRKKGAFLILVGIGVWMGAGGYAAFAAGNIALGLMAVAAMYTVTAIAYWVATTTR